MASQPAYPGYATPVITLKHEHWLVAASPWKAYVGWVEECAAGWTAWGLRVAYVGLFPTQQAAGEALVTHAGYEVLR